jgi:hypothetical protein
VTRDHLSLRPGVVWMDVEEVRRATTDQPASLSLLDGNLLEDMDGIDPKFDAWLYTEREWLRSPSAMRRLLSELSGDAATHSPAARKLLAAVHGQAPLRILTQSGQ